MRKSVLAILTVGISVAFGEPLADSIRRIQTVGDDVCSVTNVTIRHGNEKPSANVLKQWAADSSPTVAAQGAVVCVDFVLKPEPGSDIRCRIELPLPGRWDGRLWGRGNSGHAGVVPSVANISNGGTAAVTTDLGTWAYTDCGKSNAKVWPKCVCRDFNWRATHLMTVYGCKIVKAFYGREAKRRYFSGGSTGGRQAFSEALRFPEDYHGILATLPDNNAVCAEADIIALRILTHDSQGNALLNTNDMRILADAAVAYMKNRDVQPYAGRILSNPFLSDSDIEGFLSLAAKSQSKFAEPEIRKRMLQLYRGVVHNGRRLTHGATPGVYLGKQMNWYGLIHFNHFLKEHKLSIKNVSFDDLEHFAAEYGPEFNASSDNLDAFFKSGGKLLVAIGLEDQTTQSPAQIAHFERVVRRYGGNLKKVMETYRLFPIPGCAHGGGKGRALTCAPSGPAERQLLIDWRERGVPPTRLNVLWRHWGLSPETMGSVPNSSGSVPNSRGLSPNGDLLMPVVPYPQRLEWDASGNWVEREFVRPLVREPDAYYLQCDLRPWDNLSAVLK